MFDIKNFSRALLMLKRKRYQESIMDRIAKQMDQIDSMVSNLETAQLNKEVFEKLKQGNDALQLINQTFSIEDAEKIMEDTQEAAEYQEVRDKFIGKTYSFQTRLIFRKFLKFWLEIFLTLTLLKSKKNLKSLHVNNFPMFLVTIYLKQRKQLSKKVSFFFIIKKLI